ncbi:MAG: flagellar biosynthesis protein FlhF [Pseudomonadota bacterium]|nr:flagellar biosynthesis protein FlhF [Pseudomonadota bacterium]
MKIKRYTAVSMRAALAQVRAEQGPDAVILSTRRGDEGIEVIAAVDYDEALFVDANRQRAAPPVMPVSIIAPPAPVAAKAPMAPKAPVAATPPAAPAALRTAAVPAMPQRMTQRPSAAADAGYGAMQRELQDLRLLLQTGLAGMTWSDKRLREPLQARVLEELSAMDIAPDVAMALAALTPRRTSLEDPSHIPLALLVKHLPVVNDMTCISGGITAVVGPTGAGKTTTIAKLAARWCMQHGSQDLALVSTDGYRIGAREQLNTYARILGAPMHAANSGRELGAVLQRLKSKKLILIDTAGMGPRDVRLAEQLAALKLGAARARVLLALPAQGEGHALEEIVHAFAGVTPAACVLTKVDEAASLGAAISVALRHKLKIAYVCDGQRVPEDLHAAHLKRVWLIRAALRLKERIPPTRDEASLARAFGGAPIHA